MRERDWRNAACAPQPWMPCPRRPWDALGATLAPKPPPERLGRLGRRHESPGRAASSDEAALRLRRPRRLARIVLQLRAAQPIWLQRCLLHRVLCCSTEPAPNAVCRNRGKACHRLANPKAARLGAARGPRRGCRRLRMAATLPSAGGTAGRNRGRGGPPPASPTEAPPGSATARAQPRWSPRLGRRRSARGGGGAGGEWAGRRAGNRGRGPGGPSAVRPGMVATPPHSAAAGPKTPPRPPPDPRLPPALPPGLQPFRLRMLVPGPATKPTEAEPN
mmetsp:Transcript_18720/g.65371  ORF Transcript_18720/g.65371 Transcript_18720/m.65371 type:complete len:276 (+) Transcript_18720:296-1123(+)